MAKLQKHYREALDAARGIAEARGLTIHIDHGGGRHPTRLVLEGNGKRRVENLASSPSCTDLFVKRTLADIRRMCREMTGAAI